MGRHFIEEIESDRLLQSKVEPALKKPRRYKVLLLNDDYTPMEFVVEVLRIFFHKGREEAVQLMWKVHTNGKAVCGVYTKEIAETKVHLVLEYAVGHEHPLLCVMEQEQ